MFEWIGFVLLALGMTYGLIRPFFSKCWIGLFSGVFLIAGYFYFGNGLSLWQNYQTKQNTIQAKALLKTYKSPEAVVSALRKKLDNTPKHAKGWYLLGRLYASQQQWQLASEAFKKASDLSAEEVTYQVEYVMSLWELHQHQLSIPLKKQFLALLKQYPEQPALYMVLALGAKNKKTAVFYWTRLLSLLDPNSDEAELVRQNMAKLTVSKF